MTAPTFPAGISWQAVILAPLTLTADPIIGVKTTPNATLDLDVTPQIGMRPPSLLSLIVIPQIGAGVGGAGTLSLAISPSIGMIGSAVPLGVLKLSVTPSIGIGGAQLLPSKSRNINTAVTRAATH